MRIKPKSEKIARVRVIKGYTLSALAKKASIGKLTILRLEENSDYAPNPRTAKKVCEALEVDFDELFTIVV
jgi:DNA-binding XRE family transcriptional regulator